jgi:uncharacterized surface protein with fasciclin (FAS1) repeats
VKRYLAIATIAPALALGAAACGSDDEGNGSSGGGTATSQEQAPSTQQRAQDIVALAQATPKLSTLVTAVSTADATTLQGKGPFTVFAPTNASFEKLGSDQLQSLLEPANRDQLTNILTYHVVPGELKAADLSDGQTLETVAGETLSVKVDGDKVTVGDATVVQPDVEASNGVVHVIDGVLTPTA